MIFRRFGYIQARLLLERRARLIDLEAKLDQMDYDDQVEHPTRLRKTVLDDSDGEERRILLRRIERTFCEYCQ